MKNGNLEIRLNPEAGSYEVIRLTPEVLGTFSKHVHAETFLSAMADDAVMHVPSALQVEPVSEPRGAADAPGATEVAANPAPEPKQQLQPEPQPEQPAKDGAEPGPEHTAVAVSVNWNVALSRIEAGESVREVADDLGLEFNLMRARWASAVRNGTHTKPVPGPKPRKGDGDVVEGVGSVLRRGQAAPGERDLDELLLTGQPLEEIAKATGRSVPQLRERLERLEQQHARMMGGS